jgi:hypothetical protein
VDGACHAPAPSSPRDLRLPLPGVSFCPTGRADTPPLQDALRLHGSTLLPLASGDAIRRASPIVTA